jgi:hypothetical protein
LSAEVSTLRQDFRQGLSEVRAEIANTRVEMLKWSFLFWIGQVAVIASLISFLLRGIH